jgi:hypothetical protein
MALPTLAGATDRPASDWPSLRGPRHDGGSAGTLDQREGAGFAIAWRSPLGAGYSSVAVADGRAVTLFADGKNDVAVAFDARSGRELWRYVIAPTLRGQDGSFDGPIATPRSEAASSGSVRAVTCSPSTPPPAGSCGGWTSWRVRPRPPHGFGTSPWSWGVLVVRWVRARQAPWPASTSHRADPLETRRGQGQLPVTRCPHRRGREQVVAVGDTRSMASIPRAAVCCGGTRTEARCMRSGPRASCRFRRVKAASSSKSARTPPSCCVSSPARTAARPWRPSGRHPCCARRTWCPCTTAAFSTG